MNEDEKHSSGFFNGLTFGTAFGATLFFLFGTKKGRKVKARLLKKGKDFWQEIEETINEVKQNPELLLKKTKKLTDGIDQKAQQAKKQVQKKLEKTKDSIQDQVAKTATTAGQAVKEKTVKALEKAENLEKVVLTKTQKIRRFFQRKGKSLGK